jgi:hypothetical protein
MAEQQMKKKDMRTFFDVHTPLTSTKVQLYGNSPESLVGKVIRLDLTRGMRGKGAELLLRKKEHWLLNLLHLKYLGHTFAALCVIILVILKILL